MPEIAPFRGILFDAKRVDLRQVLAPLPGAAEASARAAAGWLEAGVVVRDPYKAIYRHPNRTANMLYLDGHVQPVNCPLDGGKPFNWIYLDPP